MNRKVWLKIGMAVSIVAVILGLIIAITGNMLGVWIAGFGGYGIYADYKKMKGKP